MVIRSSTATAHRCLVARPSSGARRDLAVAAVALAGPRALLDRRHRPVPPRVGLEVVGVVLVACSTVPLIGWRRSPVGGSR